MAEEITVDGLQLGAMRVVDLRDALKERDLPTDGKKVSHRLGVEREGAWGGVVFLVRF